MSTLKAILIADNRFVSQSQVYPFIKHRVELEKRFGLVFDEVRVAPPGNIGRDVHLGHADVVFIQDRCLDGLEWRGRVDFLQTAREKAKVVLLDSHASTYAGGFRLLQHVDLYVKKSLLKDTSLYGRRYMDGRIHSDYVIREGGLQVDFMGSRILDGIDWNKIVLGWNIGTAERLEREYAGQWYRAVPGGNRTIDIHCRVATAKDPRREWYTFHRESAMKRVRQLQGVYTTIATDVTIPRERYLNELRNSKIAVSPFGWGEICIRDFEAVICGSLLIKPSMEHLETLPDIYKPEDTYIPVRWDFADLREKCLYYLEEEEERMSITRNAQQEYATYFREKVFLRRVEEILRKLHSQ